MNGYIKIKPPVCLERSRLKEDIAKRKARKQARRAKREALYLLNNP